MRKRTWLTVAAVAIALGLGTGADAANDGKTRQDIAEFNQVFLDYVAKGDLLWHGNKVDGVELGTAGMACAMCHPHAADTHPYQFPKFQVSMSKFATLEEMINWCIEKPTAGKPVALDSEAMKALVAYITWSNRGAQLNPGRY